MEAVGNEMTGWEMGAIFVKCKMQNDPERRRMDGETYFQTVKAE
jgi:hypothetical protein